MANKNKAYKIQASIGHVEKTAAALHSDKNNKGMKSKAPGANEAASMLKRTNAMREGRA